MKCIAYKSYMMSGGVFEIFCNKSNRIKVGEEFHFSDGVFTVIDEKKDGNRFISLAVDTKRSITDDDIPKLNCKCKKWLWRYPALRRQMAEEKKNEV